MRAEHILISLLGLFLGFILILSGLFLFLTLFFPSLLAAFVAVLTEHPESLSSCGLALLLVGIFFLASLSFLNRRRYLLFKMGGVSLKDTLLAELAKESLSKLFPKQPVDCAVIVKRRKKIEVVAHLPFVEESKKESVLSLVEKELSYLFLKQCHYEKEFILSVSFGLPQPQ